MPQNDSRTHFRHIAPHTSHTGRASPTYHLGEWSVSKGAARVSGAANTRGWVVAVLLVRVRVLVSKNLGTREYSPSYRRTVTKLRNQLSEQSAHSTVMVGQWASDPDLTAVDEFEKQLAEGWTRNKKRKAPAAAKPQDQ
ncbi:hypothetical protein FB45DRAFT_875426 [Roridomyces roridus]|uniref:Uncharacterized protein n=1 Tax=Roridomyces roridus TaxID=1738132 RepID=A0AAD7B5E5_9AGAR|nr:hypothetical protein FB45DRAFT_875426 [Roridomyces roridus]